MIHPCHHSLELLVAFVQGKVDLAPVLRLHQDALGLPRAQAVGLTVYYHRDHGACGLDDTLWDLDILSLYRRLPLIGAHNARGFPGLNPVKCGETEYMFEM